MDLDACSQLNRAIPLARNNPEYVAELHRRQKQCEDRLAEIKEQIKPIKSGKQSTPTPQQLPTEPLSQPKNKKSLHPRSTYPN